MKFKSFVVFLFAFILSACSNPNKFVEAPPPKPTIAEVGKGASIAFVNKRTFGKEEVGAYCGGVWINKDTILTALHCAKAAARMKQVEDTAPEFRGLLRMFLPPVKDPTGTEMLYVMENEVVGFGKDPKTSHKAKVIAIEPAHDLALVKADTSAMPDHPWLRVADFAPKVGEKVFVIGHPGGLYFTFFDGTVAAYRETFPFEKGTPLEDFEGPFLQIYSAIYFGNSGGPVISSDGEIVGISCFIVPVPNQGFAVAPSAIKKFLIKAHLQNKI